MQSGGLMEYLTVLLEYIDLFSMIHLLEHFYLTLSAASCMPESAS